MLSYPFGIKKSPTPGTIKEVATGVYWLRMSLPFALDHINLWLLEEEEGWTVVDTGISTRQTKEVWEQIFIDFLGAKPIKQVIVTHLHPDHIGLAGWFSERFECPLWISKKEYELFTKIFETTSNPIPDSAIEFYQSAGYNNNQIERYKNAFSNFANIVAPLPENYKRLQNGETFVINHQKWHVVVGSGHSPEHVCLYCPELKLLISGDQVIPRITSNVSVFPIEPTANPLADWLESCSRLKETLPDDLMVLPSHQEPFYGLHHRLDELIASHHIALDRLQTYIKTPRKAIDCINIMFGREVGSSEMQFAIGETLAHLNYLIEKGVVSRAIFKGNADLFQLTSSNICS